MKSSRHIENLQRKYPPIVQFVTSFYSISFLLKKVVDDQREGEDTKRTNSQVAPGLVAPAMVRTMMARVAAFGLLCFTAGATAARLTPSSPQLRSCAQAVGSAEQKSNAMAWGAGIGRAATPMESALTGVLHAGVGKLGLRLRGGAKSKNHTNHNQNHKAHRNGIKRVKT